jgi:hypothetical protein
MASRKWKSTPFTGVRYREHKTWKHGVQKDRYFTIYYRLDGRVKEEGVGWASQGMSAKKASVMLGKLREAHITGVGPKTLTESRIQAEALQQANQESQMQLKRDGLTFARFWHDTYFPQAQRDKTIRTWKREQSFYAKWLGPTLGKLPLKKISPIHLERIKSDMTKSGGAPRSISYCLDVIRQVFNHASALDLFDGVSPTTKVKKPRADNKRLRFLSQQEASDLLDRLKEKSQDLHDMALLSLQCGLINQSTK